MADLGDELELLAERIDRASPHRPPVLIATVGALVLLIDHLSLAAEARGHLPVEVLHHPPALGAVVQGHVAGIAEAGARPFTVLQCQCVLPPKKSDCTCCTVTAQPLLASSRLGLSR